MQMLSSSTPRGPIAKAKRRVAAALRQHDEQRMQWLKGELEFEPVLPDWPLDSLEAHAAILLQLDELAAQVEAHPHPRDNPDVLDELHGWRRRIYGQAVVLLRARPALRPRASARECRPRARQRAGASSSTSSSDPGDPDPGEPPPPRLALAAPPRAIYSYACLTADQRGEVIA